jgi:hypothetical protein
MQQQQQQLAAQAWQALPADAQQQLAQQQQQQQQLQAQGTVVGAPWPASNMRLAGKPPQQQLQQQRLPRQQQQQLALRRQQQQHVQPHSKLQQAKQQPVRVSLMQAAAPQPSNDAPAAAGDNYEYEDVSPGESVGQQPGSSSSSVNGSGDGTPVVDITIGDGGTTTSGSQSGISADADASLGVGNSGSSDSNGSNGSQEQEEVDAPSSSTPGKRNEFKLDPNDPYGLSIDFGRNSKINNPFMPAAPEPSPPPPPPPSPPPGPKQGALTMDISPDTFVQAVPPSFIGVSREWTPYVFFDENLDAFERVFSQLGPSPILRIGGATQDGLTKVSWR